MPEYGPLKNPVFYLALSLPSLPIFLPLPVAHPVSGNRMRDGTAMLCVAISARGPAINGKAQRLEGRTFASARTGRCTGFPSQDPSIAAGT